MNTVPRLALVVLAVAVAADRAASQAHVLLDVHGTGQHQRLGYSVDGAGDVNGDGIPDLIVGEDPSPLLPARRVRVLSGADGSELHAFEYSSLNGSAVAGLGDLDGDGRSDLAVGQPWDRYFDVRSGATGDLLFTGDGDIGPKLVEWFAFSVSAAGDVNADGTTDVVVGSGAGILLDISGDLLRVYSGADGSLLHEVNEYVFGSANPQGLGWAVDGLGDVNGDGHDDVLASLPLKDFGMSARIVVYSGADFSVIHDISAPGLGWSAVNAGDVDGDGIDDIVAASKSVIGPVVIYSGATGGRLLTIDDLPNPGSASNYDVDGLGDIDGDGLSDIVVGRLGLVLFYSGADGRLLMRYDVPMDWEFDTLNYVAVASAGDIDGDGHADVVAGSRLDDTGAMNAGRALVISSHPEPWTDVGHALPGAAGAPTLAGTGTLVAHTSGALQLERLPPSVPVFLFVGFSELNAPFKGGTLVPNPDLTLGLASSPAGSVVLRWPRWPAGLPGFSSIWMQGWAADGTTPSGACATNALLATTPAP